MFFDARCTILGSLGISVTERASPFSVFITLAETLDVLFWSTVWISSTGGISVLLESLLKSESSSFFSWVVLSSLIVFKFPEVSLCRSSPLFSDFVLFLSNSTSTWGWKDNLFSRFSASSVKSPLPCTFDVEFSSLRWISISFFELSITLSFSAIKPGKFGLAESSAKVSLTQAVPLDSPAVLASVFVKSLQVSPIKSRK